MDLNKERYSEINIKLFNSPLEIGLRVLVFLSTIAPNSVDIQRLIYFDYLTIHSGDIENGPESLHAATPHRTGEIIVRRNMLQEGINLMASKGLIDIVFNSEGITYKANEISPNFLGYFDSTYYIQLKENAKWVINKFASYSNDDLNRYIKKHLDVWGGEFYNESVIREYE
ncbi:ABC-three component system middle component 2 [Mesobacillus subterraneus]|uniref:Threonine transporter n=1 Tax=Mesobacillus subterraneus TaxID=285983 RepID=A0A3R9DLJ9_9BACI|nr:ABC-three component system middle component 2 [Mesobacillus subterraneus]RSD20623.1 hypothetical protein EJA10_22975 [Mesobacillus subterraneus]